MWKVPLDFKRLRAQKAKEIGRILFKDPGYVFWLWDGGYLKNRGIYTPQQLQSIATIIRRASHLKIPGYCTWCNDKRPATRMFMTKTYNETLARVDFDCDRCEYEGGSLSIPITPGFKGSDIFKKFDKKGGEILANAIKYAYFGDKKKRLNKNVLEAFWTNEDNFVNP